MSKDDIDSIDELLDNLSPKLRKQVIEVTWPDSPQMQEVPKPPLKFATWPLVLAAVAGLPVAALGCLLCVTIVLAPVGLFLLLMSGTPLAYVISNRTRKVIKHAGTDL